MPCTPTYRTATGCGIPRMICLRFTATSSRKHLRPAVGTAQAAVLPLDFELCTVRKFQNSPCAVRTSGSLVLQHFHCWPQTHATSGWYCRFTQYKTVILKI